MARQKAWHKLDNTANLFPVIAGRRTANVFRMTAVMHKEVVPEYLQQALEETLPAFAAFSVRLRHGLFWSYLEQNDAPVHIAQETQAPCRYIDPLETGRYLFRVLYFGKRISLETFHVLTDGTGAMRFLKAICYRYCQLCDAQAFEAQTRDIPYGIEQGKNVLDGYLKNYTPKAQKQSFKEPRAFRVRGEPRLSFDLGVSTLLFPVQEIKTLCHQYDASVSEYLTAALLVAVYEEYMPVSGSKRPVSVFVPVDLRRIFETDTSSNFFSGFSVRYRFSGTKPEFTDVLKQVQEQFREKCTKEMFEKKLAYTAKSALSVWTRVIPLVVKNGVLRVIYEASNHASTLTLSNLGPIQVEPLFEPYFEGFRFLLSSTRQEPLKCSAVAYQDTVALTVCSELLGNDLARNLARRLSGQGIAVQVECAEGEV